jgi:hypothetical protein
VKKKLKPAERDKRRRHSQRLYARRKRAEPRVRFIGDLIDLDLLQFIYVEQYEILPPAITTMPR